MKKLISVAILLVLMLNPIKAQGSCNYWISVYNINSYFYYYYMSMAYIDDYFADMAQNYFIRMGNAGNMIDLVCNEAN